MYIRVPPPDRPTAHLVQGDRWTREELEYIQDASSSIIITGAPRHVG